MKRNDFNNTILNQRGKGRDISAAVYLVSVCNVNVEAMLDTTLIVKGALKDKFPGSGDGEPLKVLACTDKPEPQIL